MMMMMIIKWTGWCSVQAPRPNGMIVDLKTLYHDTDTIEYRTFRLPRVKKITRAKELRVIKTKCLYFCPLQTQYYNALLD